MTDLNPVNKYQLEKLPDLERRRLISLLKPLRAAKMARGGFDMIAAYDALYLDKLIIILGGQTDFQIYDPDDPKG